jgi:hypothetical protein
MIATRKPYDFMLLGWGVAFQPELGAITVNSVNSNPANSASRRLSVGATSEGVATGRAGGRIERQLH